MKPLQRTKKWLHDRYNSMQNWYVPEKGETFVVAEVTVTSDEKAVVLPAFFLYTQTPGNDTLSMLGFGAMEYKFLRWDSHRTYLGLEPDSKNEFSYSNTVNLTIGLAANNKILDNETVYLIAYNKPCFYRTDDNQKPAVAYKFANCIMPPYLLTPDVITDDYVFVKKLGK